MPDWYVGVRINPPPKTTRLAVGQKPRPRVGIMVWIRLRLKIGLKLGLAGGGGVSENGGRSCPGRVIVLASSCP